MNTSSMHWQGNTLVIHITADHPVDTPAVITLARSQAQRFLGKDARVWRIAPRRRAMKFRRAYTYTFAAVTHDRAQIEDWSHHE